MFGNQFYASGAIRKNVSLFGTLFNNIRIERDNGTDTQHQKVPILYGGREKYIARNTTDPKIEREVAAQLPRMAFELVDLYYDSARQLNPVNNILTFNSSSISSKFVPTPYIFVFNLYITARHVEDAAKIVEQIIPWFQPAFTLSAFLSDDSNCSHDIIFTLKNIDMKDNYEGPMTERRVLIWTLSFNVKTWILGPSKDQSNNVIRWVDVNQRITNESNVYTSTYVIESNTYPTLANTALEDILPSDAYIVKTDIREYFEDE